MTTHFQIHRQAALGVLTLERPPVNALSPELLEEFPSALQSACGLGGAEPARALVLAGRVGMFSAGLDIKAMLALDAPGVRRAWEAFFAAALALAEAPIPVVAALAGHAPAGGCVLALCCDSRVLADQGARIGLNEVQLGLPLPTPIRGLYDFVLGPRLSALHGALGTLFEPQQALSVGLVDELAPQDQVLDRALARASAYAALPQAALARTRRESRAPLIAALRGADSAFLDGIVETWFSAETRSGFEAALAALAKRGK